MLNNWFDMSEENKPIVQVPPPAEGSPVAPVAPIVPPLAAVVIKDDSPKALRELLEKNLKWSQIIYEQNRKINSKLMWMSIADWVRIGLILAPIVIAALLLPSLWRSFTTNYGDLLNSSDADKTYSSSASARLLELLPLNSAERDQLKAIIK